MSGSYSPSVTPSGQSAYLRPEPVLHHTRSAPPDCPGGHSRRPRSRVTLRHDTPRAAVISRPTAPAAAVVWFSVIADALSEACWHDNADDIVMARLRQAVGVGAAAKAV